MQLKQVENKVRRGVRPVRQRKHGQAAAGAGGIATPEHAFTLAGRRHSLHPPVPPALDTTLVKPLTCQHLGL